MGSLGGKTRIPYTGPALPGPSEVIVLFSSTTAFGSRCARHYQCYTFNLAITTDQNSGSNTVTLQTSNDGGVTWATVISSLVIPAIGTTFSTINVQPYQDWRVRYGNGANAQTTFAVEMSIDHKSR